MVCLSVTLLLALGQRQARFTMSCSQTDCSAEAQTSMACHPPALRRTALSLSSLAADEHLYHEGADKGVAYFEIDSLAS